MQSCSIYFLNVVLRAACDSLEGAVCFWEEVVLNVKDETGLYSVEDCLKFSAALCLKFNKKNVTYYCAEVWTASSAQPGGRKLLSLSGSERPDVFLGCIKVPLYRRIFNVN